MTPAFLRRALRSPARAVRRRRGALEMAAVRVAAALPLHRARVAVLRALGARIHPEAVVYHGFQVRAPQRLTVGARTQVGDHAILDARGGLTIGAHVNLSTGVQIWTAQHRWDAADFGYQALPVVVGDRAWIGPGVVVLPGTVVGEGTVVAAGAVARGTLEPWSLYGGVPVRKISDRPRDLTYELPGPRDKTWWW